MAHSPSSLYRNQAKRLFIDGLHDIDKGWMEELRSGCNDPSSCLKIVPRFVWEAEGFFEEDLRVLGEVITSTLEEYSFDGLVLELGFSKDMLFLYKLIRDAIGADKQLIQVAHPQSGSSFFSCISSKVSKFTHNDLQALHQIVDFVLLMTYDYSLSKGKIGPNAPLSISSNSLLS